MAALIGVRDLVVVDERDALLVCKRNHAQKVREVVARPAAALLSKMGFAEEEKVRVKLEFLRVA